MKKLFPNFIYTSQKIFYIYIYRKSHYYSTTQLKVYFWKSWNFNFPPKTDIYSLSIHEEEEEENFFILFIFVFLHVLCLCVSGLSTLWVMTSFILINLFTCLKFLFFLFSKNNLNSNLLLNHLTTSLQNNTPALPKVPSSIQIQLSLFLNLHNSRNTSLRRNAFLISLDIPRKLLNSTLFTNPQTATNCLQHRHIVADH